MRSKGGSEESFGGLLWIIIPQSVTLDQKALVLPRSLLEMHIYGPHPRPTGSGSLGMRPRNLCLNKSTRCFLCSLNLRNTGLIRQWWLGPESVVMTCGWFWIYTDLAFADRLDWGCERKDSRMTPFWGLLVCRGTVMAQWLKGSKRICCFVGFFGDRDYTLIVCMSVYMQWFC